VRAVQSGVLPAEPSEQEPSNGVASLSEPAPAERAMSADLEPPAGATYAAAAMLVPEVEERPAPMLVASRADAQPVPTSLDGVQSALGQENSAECLPDASPFSDALTVALDVAALAEEASTELVLQDDDVEFLDEEPSDALTTVQGLAVAIAAPAVPEPLDVDLPPEACTRPEPIIVRQTLRASARPEPEPVAELLPATPTFGSLALALPVLSRELIAELTRDAGLEASAAACAAASEITHRELVLPSEELTEPMPDVSPLSPGVSIVASRKSDVSELLAGFQVAADDSHRDLRRAIKEMAELDLTPAPFSALIR
jgi:hypothetical protein